MAEERVDVARPEMLRWLIVAVVVIVGIALYLRFGAVTRPVLAPAAQELSS